MPSRARLFRTGSRRWFAASTGLIAAGLLTLAACGSTPKPTATPTGSAGPSTPAATQTPATTTARIGSQCGMFPSSGAGSLNGVSTAEAIKIAHSNTELSAFAAAIQTAGLETTLQGQHSFTIFIPSNTAFGTMSKTDLIKLHNSGQLIRTLKYHVVLGQVPPSDFASGTPVTTVEGGKLTLAKSGSTYTVNKATVLCGNIRTADATIYIINQVLWPPK